MLCSKKDVLKELSFLEDDVLQNVKCFTDDKFLQFDNIISSKNLKDSLESLNFICTGGKGLREFYITLEDNSKYILQIEENEIENVDALVF